jgi:hypothetical protein
MFIVVVCCRVLHDDKGIMMVLKMGPSFCIHQGLKRVMVFPLHQIVEDILESEASRFIMET